MRHWATGKAATNLRTRKSGDLPHDDRAARLATRVSRRVLMTTTTNSLSLSLPQRLAAALVLFAIGGAMLFAVGFSGMAAAHNTAHDTRHAIGFPCH